MDIWLALIASIAEFCAGWHARKWWEARQHRSRSRKPSLRERQHVDRRTRENQRVWLELFDLDICRAHRVQACDACVEAFHAAPRSESEH